MTRPLPFSLIDAIEAALPQTQCGKCKTAGCRPYAEAVVAGEPHNRCVPGGAETIAALAQLTGRAIIPLDVKYGIEPTTQVVAFIREDECIGCTKCIQVCPVDAIVGAAKLMHTIIASECSGCDLCIPACPVDCIELHHSPKITDSAEKERLKQQYRTRFLAREQRLEKEITEKMNEPGVPLSSMIAQKEVSEKPIMSPMIAAALARSQLKKLERKLQQAQSMGESIQSIELEIAQLKQELKLLG
jgi:electron transport complex protein RnfB